MKFFTSVFSIFALTSPVAACSGSSGGLMDSGSGTEDDAKVCAAVSCSGHGTCRSMPTRDGGHAAHCFCDTGFVNENADETACIASSSKTEGYGYRFDAEPSADVVNAELEALRGPWYSSRRDWSVNEKANDISTHGYVFALPEYAGPATWRAADLIEARAGKVRLVPPQTRSLSFGPALGAEAGALEGFRPLQFSRAESPDQSEATILYQRGEEEVSVPAQGTRKRARLQIVRCPDSFTDGIAKPKIEQCVRDDHGAVRVPTGFVQEMFDN